MAEYFPTRRRFLYLAASATVASVLAPVASGVDAPITGSIAVNPSGDLCAIPSNFTGLSYESAQLANPDFFAASNHQLIRLFRELSSCGVLRLGGGSSSYTRFSAKPVPPPFETFGPDTSKTVKKGTVTSGLALRNLRSFLDAANWTCLYGLNLGQGTKENAVLEAEAAQRILGPRLVAFQLGNEPDGFSRFRPHGYSPQQFINEWTSFHDAITARVPQACFAGPDISNKLAYLTAFAQEAPHYPDVILLTLHYYAMGPAGNPGATLQNLLSPDPRLTTLKWRKIPILKQAMRTAHLPCRITEANSCWNGGQPGVSDVFASSLWCADMMLHFASLGFAGVNLHGGGNGIYSPIVGSLSAGFAKRPEFFGIQFAQHFARTTLLRTDLRCNSDRLTAYAARNQQGCGLLALINKTNTPAELRLSGPWSKRRWQATLLTASSLEAHSGTGFHKAKIDRALLQLPAHSALLLAESLTAAS